MVDTGPGEVMHTVAGKAPSPPPHKASRHPEVLAPVRVLEWLPLVVSKAFEHIVGSRYSRREKLIPPAQLVS